MKSTRQFKRSALTTAITTAIIASTNVSLAIAQEQAAEGENLLLEESLQLQHVPNPPRIFPITFLQFQAGISKHGIS